MECWEFPPRYDASYRPEASSRYWFPVRETMPAAERERAILKRLQQVCHYAYAHSAFYRTKWDEAGFHPSALRSLEDFEAKVPVITKRDLRESQAKAPAFGEYLCVPRVRDLPYPRLVRYHRAPHCVRHQPQRLGVDRECARARDVGHGYSPWRHGVPGGDLQPLSGKLGGAGRRRAPGRNFFPIRSRRIGDECACRRLAGAYPPHGLLRNSDLCAAPGRCSEGTKASTHASSA